MNRFISSLVLICFSLILGACAGTLKMTPDGKRCLGATTAGDTLDRSHTYVAFYECEMKDGKLVVGRELKPGEMVHGQTVPGQAIVGATGGMVGAMINNNAMRAVANKQCKENCGPTFNNQVMSVAEALNQNKANVNVGLGACPKAGCPD